MARSLPLITAGSVVAAAVVGGLVARSGLRPVRLLTEAVQHVIETKDFQPVTVHKATGEVARLASSFNRLLRMVALMRERQTRLVLDAGHELRNPLTSLRANIDLLAIDFRRGRLSADQRTELVGDVQAQLGELSGLVTDLTHLARDEDEAKPQPIDVCEVVQAAVDRVVRRGQDRVIDVELQPLFMMGHPESLSRAVVNLLDNAVKWSPSGGTVRVRLDGNRLRVSDEGPGIPEADLPYVFDRFFRGQTGRGTPGTGLGLSIVAKAVMDHGGTVEAGRSASGGAEFTVQLPGVTSREALPALRPPTAAELSAARSVEAAAVEASVWVERAVVAAAEAARAAAVASRRARAAAATRAARVVAEAVRQQAVTVHREADEAARTVATATAGTASRVQSTVLPGHELEARRVAALVAQVAVEAATAVAEETVRAAGDAACAAAASARDVAAEAAEADRAAELEVRRAAQAVQDTARTAATELAAQTQSAIELINSTRESEGAAGQARPPRSSARSTSG